MCSLENDGVDASNSYRVRCTHLEHETSEIQLFDYIARKDWFRTMKMVIGGVCARR